MAEEVRAPSLHRLISSHAHIPHSPTHPTTLPSPHPPAPPPPLAPAHALAQRRQLSLTVHTVALTADGDARHAPGEPRWHRLPPLLHTVPRVLCGRALPPLHAAQSFCACTASHLISLAVSVDTLVEVSVDDGAVHATAVQRKSWAPIFNHSFSLCVVVVLGRLTADRRPSHPTLTPHPPFPHLSSPSSSSSPNITPFFSLFFSIPPS